jgi:riboflavin synthase
MFTGLVEELCKVKSITKGAKSIRLTIEAGKICSDMKLGDSIAVNGICLTATDFIHNQFTADVMPETMQRTALSKLKIGDVVNLERALKMGDRLGGHIVSGHIDGIGTINNKEQNDNAIIININTSAEIIRYIIKKGSIAIDGISLTVVDVSTDWFTVSLIPHTATMTTLGFKTKGDLVNLETDVLGKYVEKMLNNTEEPKGSNMSLGFLSQHGYL